MTERELAIAAEIRRLAREELRLAIEAADDDDLGARLDSLARLTLVVAIEDRFRVILSEEDGTRVRSLADLAHLVVERSAVEKGSP
jgi:acyl carrier protein